MPSPAPGTGCSGSMCSAESGVSSEGFRTTALPAITAIYNEVVANSNAVWTEKPDSEADRLAFVYNVYTDAAHRRPGARRQRIAGRRVDVEARSAGRHRADRAAMSLADRIVDLANSIGGASNRYGPGKVDAV